ncbi:hypothetical protein ACTI_48730 [Actinoplanes sp. OR16]|uniref:hypothetical protein n=1 Tax=Actinoplanes sp. OR16 TaxID=946334 RepID=UPI000F70B765|nr:hypothetical protein [Actinoplanes sp. OR16]BBH68188.1 hypothetical protein ACTI_48730 [Actinoplanes sp. OR16]
MKESVLLGEITCPSGELVLMDGGSLGLWSGELSPDETAEPGTVAAADFEIAGADALTAARSFDRQSGRYLYDIPQHSVAKVHALFQEHCEEHGFQAALRLFPRRVPHRERLRRALKTGAPDFLVAGVPAVPVGDLPADRPLPVTATPGPDGWREIQIWMGAGTPVETRQLGAIVVEQGRFVFADVDALGDWVHEETLDGLADLVFWGRDEELIAAEFRTDRIGILPGDPFGWANMPDEEAYQLAVRLQHRQFAEPQAEFAFDFRPHSHQWQAMAGIRGSIHDAAVVTAGNADVMVTTTSVGDGAFPVRLDLDVAGKPAAIRIAVTRSAL